MEELIIAVVLGIFALFYFGYQVIWMTLDLEKKIKEQRVAVKELRQRVNVYIRE